MSTAIDSYLRPREVAEVLGIKVDTVLAFIKAGQLTAVNVAHPDAHRRPHWRVTTEALEEFVSGRTVQPAPVRPAPQPRRRGEDEGPY